MKIRVQVSIEYDGQHYIEEVACLQRDELHPETLGLALIEAKTLLTNLQQVVVTHQVTEYHQQHRYCDNCGASRRRKGTNHLVYRTLFGTCELKSERFYTCGCQPHTTKSESPLTQLLPERTSPELLYLQTKWAALMSYELTASLLNDVLPIELCNSTVRQNAYRIAERLENELGDEQAMFIDGCPAQWASLPRPDGRLTVGIDGGFIQARDADHRKAGWFEMIVGKSLSQEGNNKCFGYVTTYDVKPKRRLHEMLRSQGLQMNQDITFLSDGGENVRHLPLYLSPQAEHLLDWFHITMRLTVMHQIFKGLPALKIDDAESTGAVAHELDRIKWFLWHGNVYKALESIDDLLFDLEPFADEHPGWMKLYRTLQEFATYIRNNSNSIPNYGERHRYGEIISTAFVESAVNQLISKRFVKKQQMRWTKQGAHLLLQLRIQVINDDLQAKFRHWYPHAFRKDGHISAAA